MEVVLNNPRNLIFVKSDQWFSVFLAKDIGASVQRSAAVTFTCSQSTPSLLMLLCGRF